MSEFCGTAYIYIYLSNDALEVLRLTYWQSSTLNLGLSGSKHKGVKLSGIFTFSPITPTQAASIQWLHTYPCLILFIVRPPVLKAPNDFSPFRNENLITVGFVLG